MNKILTDISAEVEAAFQASGYDKNYAIVTLSNRPDLCEYQCNGAMAAAKVYKKKPLEIATQVADQLSNSILFSEAQAVMPGFINLRLNTTYLADYLNKMLSSPKWGVVEAENPRRMMIDYGGANVAKPLHVGHLRAAVIGESIKRIGRFLGHSVIGDVHLGDWGLQMGLIIEELKERKPDLVYFKDDYQGEYPTDAPFTISELEQIYPAASAKSKVDEVFKEKAQSATLKLQNGYEPYKAIWRHIMNLSVADLKKNYHSLNVSFDLWKGESDAQPYIPELIQMLKDKGLAYDSQGALVVDIAEEGDSKELPPCIVQKSDGAALYATSDLGTLIEREKQYQPDYYLYVVDKRQDLHFIQVFRVAKKSGIVKPDTEMKFLGFGTMNGKDGKPFKTRDGGVMRLETLIANINEKVFQKIVGNRTMSDEEAAETSKIVGLAALKYGDLSNQAAKDYVFDMERFTSFEGNTGPYILYTIVRIKSILGRYHRPISQYLVQPADNESEKALMLQISKYSEVLEACFQETAPHKLCQYIYELSNVCNRFYRDNKILTEEDQCKQESWISLIYLTKEILNTGIELLGIEAPDRM